MIIDRSRVEQKLEEFAREWGGRFKGAPEHSLLNTIELAFTADDDWRPMRGDETFSALVEMIVGLVSEPPAAKR